MDLILKRAKKFTHEHIENDSLEYGLVISEFDRELGDLYTDQDKIKFINHLLLTVNNEFASHKKICKNLDECSRNDHYERFIYRLTYELSELGVHFNNDTFTQEERVQAESKLDAILKDLASLKAGQQIIFEDIMELKDLYFLGKKKWHQLLIGKITEMTVSGIVNETISKTLIDSYTNIIPRLHLP